VFEDLVTDAQLSDRLGKGGAKHHRKILRDNIQSTQDPVTDAQLSERLGKGGAKYHRNILRDNIQSTQMYLRIQSLKHNYQTDLERVQLNTTARFFMITSKVLKCV
jgi:hypothetical protein